MKREVGEFKSKESGKEKREKNESDDEMNDQKEVVSPKYCG